MREMSINDLVGTRIRYLRGRLKESGDRFGQRLEPYLGKPWSRQTVWEAENGKREFRIEEVFALAQAAKVTVQFFFVDPPKKTTIKWQSGSDVSATELTSLLREPGQPTSRREEVRAARRLVKEAQDRLRNADEYLKFIGDPEDAKR